MSHSALSRRRFLPGRPAGRADFNFTAFRRPALLCLSLKLFVR